MYTPAYFSLKKRIEDLAIPPTIFFPYRHYIKQSANRNNTRFFKSALASYPRFYSPDLS